MSSSPSDSVSSISEESEAESLPRDSDPDSSLSSSFFPLVAIFFNLNVLDLELEDNCTHSDHHPKFL